MLNNRVSYNRAGMRTSMTTTGSALATNAGTHSYAYDPTYKLLEANYCPCRVAIGPG